MSLHFNMLSRFVIAFLPRYKCLLISWQQSRSAMILEHKEIKSVIAFPLLFSICIHISPPPTESLPLHIPCFQIVTEHQDKLPVLYCSFPPVIYFTHGSVYMSEKAMAPHSSTLAWKIPWMEEPGRLQSMRSLRVGHKWVISLHFSLSCIGEVKGNPLQYSCLENPRDRGAWWAAVYTVAQSRTWLKQLSRSSSVYM